MSAASATPAAAPAAGVKKARKPAGPLVTAWLLVYNVVAAASWSYVLYLIAHHFAKGGSIDTLYEPIHQALYFAQTLAVMEVLHAMLRFVPSPVATTALQVASRIMLVWGIFYPVPESRNTLGFFLASLVSEGHTSGCRCGGGSVCFFCALQLLLLLLGAETASTIASASPPPFADLSCGFVLSASMSFCRVLPPVLVSG